MTDVQELGPHAMKKRAMKNKSEKKGRQSAANPKCAPPIYSSLNI
jgi:hypothetical protein